MELDHLIKSMQKEYGELAIRKGDQFKNKLRIPTGSIALDYIFGGGIPMGKTVEFQGRKSSGKSLVSMRILDQQMQVYKKPAVWIDAERSWDDKWARQHIKKYKDVNVVQLPSAEKIVDFVKDALMCSDPPGIIVLDSIAALSSQIEQDRSATEEQRLGLTAKLMGYALRVWTPLADAADCPIIMINQLRDDVGAYSPWGKKETAPGGRAKEFFASLIVDFRAGEYIKDKTEVVGQKVNIQILKSKVWGAKQYSNTSLLFYLPCNKPEIFCETCERYCPKKEGYFDSRTEAIDLGMELGVIVRSGPMYAFKDLKVKGRDAFIEALDNKLIEDIRKTCLSLIGK